MRWIEQGLGIAPIEFQKLVDAAVKEEALLRATASLAGDQPVADGDSSELDADFRSVLEEASALFR